MLINSLFLLLMSIAVTTRRDKSILYSRISIIVLLLTSYIALDTLELKVFNNGIGLFGGLFHMTAITNIFQIFIFILTAIILQLTGFNQRKLWKFSDIKALFLNKTPFARVYYWAKNNLNKPGEQYKIIEYPLIILFIVTGASFLISSSDIVSIFLSIELQSYGLYLLCSLNRNSELSTSAGLTYFLLGGLSSCFILLGTGLLYVNSGTTNLDNFYVITNLFDLVKDNDSSGLFKINYIHFSLLVMSIGFLFKISAAPFHFWSPDVYDAIPTVTTTFVAIIAKISILIFLLEIIHYTNNTDFNYNWTIVLLFSSFLSLIVGTVLGLNQSRIKRLFAYSTISHLGFILLALSINSIESIQAFMFYLMQYSISNLNIFVILITIGYTLYFYIDKINKVNNNLLDKQNSPIQLISQLKGYFSINPMLAISFIITIYSLVGIPPLIGFFAKQMVLSSALDNGYVFISMVAILTSVISAVYYLSIVKQVFFYESDYEINPKLNYPYEGQDNIKRYTINHILLSSTLSITISVLTLITLLFILNPQEWLSITNILAIIMFNL